MLLEVFGFVTGLIYLFLEIRQKKIMWVVGAISGAAYIIIFMNQRLFANMSIQIYYLLVSIYGWLAWTRIKRMAKRSKAEAKSGTEAEAETETGAGAWAEPGGGETRDKICYKHADKKTLAWSFVLFVVLSSLLYAFLEIIDKDPMPLLDAATFSLSIIATWWLSRCIIDQWIVWVFTDVAIAAICFHSGLVLSGILYILYSIFAVCGYYYWKRVGIRIKR